MLTTEVTLGTISQFNKLEILCDWNCHHVTLYSRERLGAFIWVFHPSNFSIIHLLLLLWYAFHTSQSITNTLDWEILHFYALKMTQSLYSTIIADFLHLYKYQSTINNASMFKRHALDILFSMICFFSWQLCYAFCIIYYCHWLDKWLPDLWHGTEPELGSKPSNFSMELSWTQTRRQTVPDLCSALRIWRMPHKKLMIVLLIFVWMLLVPTDLDTRVIYWAMIYWKVFTPQIVICVIYQSIEAGLYLLPCHYCQLSVAILYNYICNWFMVIKHQPTQSAKLTPHSQQPSFDILQQAEL